MGNQRKDNQKILDGITHLQTDLEIALECVLEQAGSKVKLERREEFHKQVENTKQLLERLKSRYV